MRILVGVVVWICCSSDGSTQETPSTADSESRLGGVASVHDSGPNAFGFAAAVLDAKQRRAFAVGNAFFKDNWITAPASAAGRDGLGPLFNARSCSSCHFRDGRGRPAAPGETTVTGFLLRLGVATEGADRPHPIYGGQLQDRAIGSVKPEASIRIRHETIRGEYADGTPFELRRPRYELTNTAYGAIAKTVRIGPRVAPQLIGLGLLEAVPEADILKRADPKDRDGDGISGRAHFVMSRRSGKQQLGRFGWRATQPTIEEQTATAFVNDIGITSSLFPAEILTKRQRKSIEFSSGGSPEISDRKLARVTFYCQVLAVPAQRTPLAPLVRRGRAVFDRFGCAKCHVAELRTGDGAAIESLAGQRIHPFTDLLLHDMGDGLADDKRDGQATPTEWRTPPLWGIGLFKVVNGHTRYLHDGRARNLHEAILWHGGEAARAQRRFVRATRADREALLAFLASL
jgi:CxxC motif-containing protein (DUF1111 family)